MRTCLVMLVGVVFAADSFAAIRYVNVVSTNPTPPYTNWATAASVIQDAVDVAETGDEIVVTNGVYATGGRALYGTMTNRVAVDRPLSLRSVNGPQLTVIEGLRGAGWASVRCAYLTNGATLSGFTLTNGGTISASPMELGVGGGIYCSSLSVIVSNCVIVGNVSWNGGGAYAGTLYDCVLTNNKSDYGAGASLAALYNCTLMANSHPGPGSPGWGGGAFRCTLNNCIISSNSVGSGRGGGAIWSTLNNCTVIGNIAGSGGGAYESTLSHCTLGYNSAQFGGGADACVLTNCTLEFNLAQRGGGAYSGTLTGCTLISNTASDLGGAFDASVEGQLINCVLRGNSAESGGGAYKGFLWNCMLTGNWATDRGGGATAAALYNCTLVGNSASNYAGGTYAGSSVVNSIIYYNSAPNGPNYLGILSFCCATPPVGPWVIGAEPLFLDDAAGNFRLAPNSPCINAGRNFSELPLTDLDGNARVVGGTVDMGAYECQSPVLLDYYLWLQNYGLQTIVGSLYVDSDLDGMNNWQEWQADTVPTNALSALWLMTPFSSASGVTLNWKSVNTRRYWLERASGFAAQPAFSLIMSNLPGQPGSMSFTDTNTIGNGEFFYRVGVQP